MKNKGISYIVPIRGREYMIPGFIENIKKYNEDFEILFCNQVDDLLFRKGQLANLGYTRAAKDLISFINIDFRFLDFVPIVEEIKKVKTPLITFSKAAKVEEPSPGELLELTKRGNVETPGGCQVFTREQFEKSFGHTNLIMGWGIDDVVVDYRVSLFSRFTYLPYCMGHVRHDKFKEYSRREYVKAKNFKVALCPPSLPKYDSFRETLAKEVSIDNLGKNILRFNFTSISVPDSFSEMKRYRAQLDVEKQVLGL